MKDIFELWVVHQIQERKTPEVIYKTLKAVAERNPEKIMLEQDIY